MYISEKKLKMSDGTGNWWDPFCPCRVTRCQFHQHFTWDFLVQKCLAHLFYIYSSALWLFGERIPAQKLLVKCRWNWLQVSISSTFYKIIFGIKGPFAAFLLLYYGNGSQNFLVRGPLRIFCWSAKQKL